MDSGAPWSTSCLQLLGSWVMGPPRAEVAAPWAALAEAALPLLQLLLLHGAHQILHEPHFGGHLLG